MKKFKNGKPIYGLNVKFVEGKKIIDPEGRIIHIHLESRNTSVPMIVPGEGSEADKQGVDGIFPICSEKCGDKMRDALHKEIGTIQTVNKMTNL
ncbi:hypothetical protein [Neobacillus niacini]|uniref:hypothetical protein n=1 Tax=Neobacillus niacini TaxID=86668 RepID=UPI00203E4883|nr:hypothetical protein [Neobacillus niacini]MCM3694614.1 hypothetical protein [Neobacillus niacini]